MDGKDSDKQALPGGGRLLRWGVLGLAVAVGVIAWLITRGSDDEPSSAAAPKAGHNRIVSVGELRDLAAELEQPIYWAGPMSGRELELRELGEGVQILYLQKGTPPGETPNNVPTVGSYPLANPRAAVENVTRRPGATVHHADGREVVVDAKTPTSAYFASPENSVQVEVYAPSPKRALSLALSGRVQPAG